MQTLCFWQLCINALNLGMSCTESGKGSIDDLKAFIEKHQGRTNIVLSECVKAGESPSLTFNLPRGLRFREDLKK